MVADYSAYLSLTMLLLGSALGYPASQLDTALNIPPLHPKGPLYALSMIPGMFTLAYVQMHILKSEIR